VNSFRIKYGHSEFAIPEDDEFTVGRGSECHLRLADSSISRQHAVFRVEAGRLIVEDPGSRNGIFLNGKRVRGWSTVGVGAEIRLGRQSLVVVLADGVSNQAADQSIDSTLFVPGAPAVTASAESGPAVDLSEREREVLSMIARGHTQREVSEALEISPKTVETYIRRVRTKLSLTSRSELVEYARLKGIIQAPPA